MTKEEAIEILWRYDVNFEPHPPEEVMHTIDMAIEALEGKDTNVPTKDCISRQDAIDAIKKDVENLDKELMLYTLAPSQYTDNFKSCIESRIDELNDALMDIESLPSADTVEVVRCKDCKHRYEAECPMYFEEQFDIDEGDGYYDTDYIIHDYTQDDGYCYYGLRKEQNHE